MRLWLSLAALGWLAQATGSGASGASPLPAWIGTGVSSAFLSYLWWTERSDRKEAEQRTRDVLTDSRDRLLEGQRLLDRQSELLRDLIQRERP